MATLRDRGALRRSAPRHRRGRAPEAALSLWSRVSQLRSPQVRTCAWWSRRSSIAAMAAVSHPYPTTGGVCSRFLTFRRADVERRRQPSQSVSASVLRALGGQHFDLMLRCVRSVAIPFHSLGFDSPDSLSVGGPQALVNQGLLPRGSSWAPRMDHRTVRRRPRHGMNHLRRRPFGTPRCRRPGGPDLLPQAAAPRMLGDEGDVRVVPSL